MTLKEEIKMLSGIPVDITRAPAIAPVTLTKVQGIINKVIKNYKKINYEIGNVKLKPFNFFKKNQGCNDAVPAAVPANNDNTLYIETTVLENIEDWNELEKIIIHELAHLATDKDHEDKEFIEAIQKYKKLTGIEAAVNPENENIDYSNSFPNFQEKMETLRKLNSPARRAAHDDIRREEQLGNHARFPKLPKAEVKLIKKAT